MTADPGITAADVLAALIDRDSREMINLKFGEEAALVSADGRTVDDILLEALRAGLIEGDRGEGDEELTLADRLYEVQERVYGGRTGLGPVREAVATPAPVVGPRVDRFRRAAFHDVYVDASTRQRAALEDGGDRRPRLSLRGAHLPHAHQMPRRCVHSAGIWMRAIRLQRVQASSSVDCRREPPRSAIASQAASPTRCPIVFDLRHGLRTLPSLYWGRAAGRGLKTPRAESGRNETTGPVG